MVRGRLIVEGRANGKRDQQKGIDGLWEVRNRIAERRVGKHDLYWGCHSCDMMGKHRMRECICSCGAKPGKYSIFWGDDFKGFTEKEKRKRVRGMIYDSPNGSTEVIDNPKESIINGKYNRNRRNNVRRIKRNRKSRTQTGYSG